MALFLLSYDLVKQKDYKTLWDELAKFQAVRVVESVWCFKRINTNAANLRTYFQKYIDADDRLLVTEMSETNWATWNALKTPKNLP